MSRTVHKANSPKTLLELNTMVFLSRLAEKYARPLRLIDVPDAEWKAFVERGFTVLWLMGVWKRSEAGRKVALKHTGLRSSYSTALPDWEEGDVVGSPYSVASYYEPDPRIASRAELILVKRKLNGWGVELWLDFVPNHLACDHPWVQQHPGWFVSADLKKEGYFPASSGTYVAHGKDPYFPAWTDTAQVNIFNQELREALTQTLEGMVEVADGLRCDMAMLLLKDVFKGTWKDFLKSNSVAEPQKEFWPEAISRVKQRNPDFSFMAEVYWGLEELLLEQGFDYVYDKELYDHLKAGRSNEIRQHLQSRPWLSRGAHFIENHDEERAVVAFGGPAKAKAAAFLSATIPGLRFFFDQQQMGAVTHLPIQLKREPEEKGNTEVIKFYDWLYELLQLEPLRHGDWHFVDSQDLESPVFMWSWHKDDTFVVLAVNLSSTDSTLILKPSEFSIPLSAPIKLFDYDEPLVPVFDQSFEEHWQISLHPWQCKVWRSDASSKDHQILWAQK